MQLTGREEARLEYIAANYLAMKVLSRSVSIMSCGGASSQVAYGDEVISLSTGIIATTEAILERGSGFLHTYDAQLDSVVSLVPADLGGTFCMIEFFGVFAARCIKALLARVVPVAEGLAAVETYLDAWHATASVELDKPDDTIINEA